ncbi:MAG: choice-of-anchor I family protein [Bryobacteraceae bacterium]
MRKTILFFSLASVCLHAQVKVNFLGAYAGGGAAASEISAYDPGSRRTFVTNGATKKIDILDVSNPTAPTKAGEITIPSQFGDAPNSVAVRNGVVAVAMAASPTQNPGYAVFFDAQGRLLSGVQVGALPDMITFTPDGKYVLVANEGEPNDSYSIDPEGSVSIIDLANGAANLTNADVATADFKAFTKNNIDPRIRIFGPNATVAQDLEPEYIAVSPDSKTAWVSLQENNAFAIIDIAAKKVTRLVALGFKDHSAAGNGLDPSDRDGGIKIARWPVLGMYMPDAIGTFTTRGVTYLISANEGDTRDYAGFSEEARVSSLKLSPRVFPNAKDLQANGALGRLTVSNASGDDAGDGVYESIMLPGARSFSIWSTDGQLVFDSGDRFEQVTARAVPKAFNSNGAEDTFDTRSDNKGPEPEGVVTATIGDQTFAFISLERTGGFFVYEVTDPRRAEFIRYVAPRAGADGKPLDVSPEGIAYVAAADSPNGKPMLILSHEVSGTTSFYEFAVTPEVTSRVEVTNFGVVTASGAGPFGQVQRTYKAAMNVRNTTADTIAGPLQLVFTGLPAGVTVAGSTTSIEAGQVLAIPGVSSLGGGASQNFTVEFDNPAGAAITFGARVYSGSF